LEGETNKGTTKSAGRSAMRTNKREKLPQLPQTDIDDAMGQLETAFALIGCVNGNTFTCPVCGESRKGKVVLRPAKKYWKCYVCGTHPDDPRYKNAIDLVKERCNVPFPKAVNILLGRNDGPIPKAKIVEILATAKSDDGFTASDEPWVFDLYTEILESPHCSLERAVAYYSDRHISADAVAAMRFRYITDPEALRNDLITKWGEEKLIQAGIAVENENGLRLLCGWNYPVIEPAIDHTGKVRNLQFRPSLKQREKIRAHKRGEGPYVPTFMSIKGAGPKHLIGIGLHLLAEGDPRVVMVAEGAADAAAGYTLGAAGMYAIPGTNIMPPKGVVQYLEKRGHKIVVALDGDEAGIKARPTVAAHFRNNGYAHGASRRLGIDVPGLLNDDLRAALAAAGQFAEDIYRDVAEECGLSELDAIIADEDASKRLRSKLQHLHEESCWVREKTDMPEGLDVCDILIRTHAKRGCTCQSCKAWRARSETATQ
jgi:5S rRNA maturation endonuclease (ribonuclease M5)